MRKSASITTPDNPEVRQFHLEEAKAKTFAANVIVDSGMVAIRPFEPSRALLLEGTALRKSPASHTGGAEFGGNRLSFSEKVSELRTGADTGLNRYIS
jgi:hypothetical protein